MTNGQFSLLFVAMFPLAGLIVWIVGSIIIKVIEGRK